MYQADMEQLATAESEFAQLGGDDIFPIGGKIVNPLFEDNDGDGEIEIDDDKSMTMSLGAASSLQNIAEASAAASDGLGQKNFEVALKNNQSSERKSSMLTRIAIFLNFFFFFFFLLFYSQKALTAAQYPGRPPSFVWTTCVRLLPRARSTRLTMRLFCRIAFRSSARHLARAPLLMVFFFS